MADSTYRESAFKAMVTSAIAIIGYRFQAPALKIVTKPARKVIAENTFKKHELVLLFDNPKVSLIEKKPAANAKALRVFTSDQSDGDKDLWIMVPPLSSEIVVPAWSVAVATETQIGDANMEIVHIEIENRVSGFHGGQAMSLNLPIMRNKNEVLAGDELIVNRFSSIEQEVHD